MKHIKLLSMALLLSMGIIGCASTDAQPQNAVDQNTDMYVRGVLNKAGVDVPQHTQINISRTPEEIQTSSTGPSVMMRSDRNYFGWGASAVTAASLYKGMDVGKTTSPEISTNPETGATTISQSTFGKTTAGGGGGTWLSALWQTAKDWGMTIGIILVVIVVGGAVLYFMVPAAQPIINGILRAIASLFPILGSLVENNVGTKKETAIKVPLEDTIIGIQESKDAIDTMITNTDFSTTTFNKETFKANIRDLINITLKANHDQTDEDMIAKIKQANRL